MDNIEVLSEDVRNYNYRFKIVIIGDSGTGKTCFSIQAIKNYFLEFSNYTMGANFLFFNLGINNKLIQLKIIELGGLEKFKSLYLSYYRNSSLAILVYSIDDKESFHNIEYWLIILSNIILMVKYF